MARTASFWLLIALGLVPACGAVPVKADGERLPAGLNEAALRIAWESAVDAEDWARAVAVRQRLAALDPHDGLRRLAVASALRQAGHIEIARREAGALLSDAQVLDKAQVLLAELEADAGDFLAAADRYQTLAEAAGDSEQARMYWERTARVAELGGDSNRAVAALNRALAGLTLRDSERRLLDRMRAFQAGEFRHVADAAQVARDHRDAAMRLLAVDYLIADNGEEANYALADVLSDSEPEIPNLALAALAGSQDPLVRSAIEAALDHPAREVRLVATEAFARDASYGDAGALVRRLDPEDRALFRVQCREIERLTGRVEGLPLDGGLESRNAIASAWREWWNRDS
ncbi:MAG: hypothetical protein MK209_06305 [Planctomycetes bacterium]|nr:hypothetical protein [Planctomycetota bacterium]